MIKYFNYGIRKDGVKLILKLDVEVNENGEPLFMDKQIIDENNNTKTIKQPIPTGYKIHKVDTDEYYDEAIDVEDAPFEYEETDILIDEDYDVIFNNAQKLQP